MLLYFVDGEDGGIQGKIYISHATVFADAGIGHLLLF